MTRTSAEQPDAETVEEKEEEEDQEEAKSSSSCDPKLTPVQATPIASSMFYKACMYHSLHIHPSHTELSLYTLGSCLNTRHTGSFSTVQT